MKKRNTIILLLSLILLVGLLIFAAVFKKEEKVAKYNYLVLVNKYTQLSEEWEGQVELVDAKNAWDEDIQVEKEAYKQYLKLAKALKRKGITIELDSVYRSVSDQQKLWDDWSKDPEKGIDYVRQYVAVPGFSEHHTGLAIDICLRKNGKLVYENDDMIADRKTFAKIHEKIAKYGFILRYLEGKDEITGYAYEPWHLRYVGSPEIAKEIMDNNLTFEEYLAKNDDLRSNESVAKYRIEKTLQEYFKEIYGDKITNSRFNITRIYTEEEIANDGVLGVLDLGEKDLPFEVTYQIQPAEGADINALTIPDGEYDENLGWIKNINRLGILKYNEKTNTYSITNFGTGW